MVLAILAKVVNKFRLNYLKAHQMFLMMVLVAYLATFVAVLKYFMHQSWRLDFGVSFWLWTSLILSALIESLVEYQGEVYWRKLVPVVSQSYFQRINQDQPGDLPQLVSVQELDEGDIILAGEGTLIPGYGKIISGVARLDESWLSGEPISVVRSAEGDSEVQAGSRVIAGNITLQLKKLNLAVSLPSGFGAKTKFSRKKLLETLLLFISLSSLVAVGLLGAILTEVGITLPVNLLVVLWICLAPTTAASLLPTVSLVGMLRFLKYKILAFNSRAIELPGQLDTVIFDKTGTVSSGYLTALKIINLTAEPDARVVRLVWLATQGDSSPEARSIAWLAREQLSSHYAGHADRLKKALAVPPEARVINLDEVFNLGGMDLAKPLSSLRWGFVRDIQKFCPGGYEARLAVLQPVMTSVMHQGDALILIADQNRIIGAVQMRDNLKKGCLDLSAKLAMDKIDTVMVSGDSVFSVMNAADAMAVGDFVAVANAEAKSRKVFEMQKQGYLVGVVGDGINDALAIEQSDVAIAMNTGSLVTKQLSDIVDLESSPAKLPLIVKLSKKMLLVRGALTTFSIVNDLVKCLVILPVLLQPFYASLAKFNFLGLHSVNSAVLAVLTFNALIVPISLPLVFWGIKHTSGTVNSLLKQNLGYFGFLGIMLPLIMIKLLDLGYGG